MTKGLTMSCNEALSLGWRRLLSILVKEGV